MRKFLAAAALAAAALPLSPAPAQAGEPSPSTAPKLTLAFDPSDELCPRPRVVRLKPLPPVPLDGLQIWRAAGWGVGNG
ncbi:hypothetical protein AB0J83_21190 [Actinoplanes sp. NPDC049596]|uniref:hypothetical protein n=1 Tax=unclassified Actinoplanes TaxID=2626549 RepID=UPI0034412094